VISKAIKATMLGLSMHILDISVWPILFQRPQAIRNCGSYSL